MDTPSTPRRPIHHSLMAILFPPLAHWHHDRYSGKSLHLALDTLLNAVMLGVAGWLILLFAFAPVDQRIGVRWGVPTFVSGQPAHLTLTLRNQSGRVIHGVTAHLERPSEWRVTESSAHVGEMVADSEATLSFDLVPIGAPKEIGRLRLVLDGTIGHSAFAQVSVLPVQIASSVLLVTYRTPPSLTSGQPSTAILTIQNTSAETQTFDLEQSLPAGLTVGSSSIPLINDGWKDLPIKASATTTIIMTWNASVTSTTTVKPVVRAFLHIANQPTLMSTTSSSLKLFPAASPSSVINQPEQSVAALSAQAQYFGAGGMQFGYGALPLRVGQQSTLRIFLNVRPSQTTGTAAVLTTTLPIGVSWANNASVSAGSTITYNSTTRTVRWVIGDWSSQMSVLSGSFDVQITPTAPQRGSYPRLTGLVRLQYTDISHTVQLVTAPAATSKTANPAAPTDGKVR